MDPLLNSLGSPVDTSGTIQGVLQSLARGYNPEERQNAMTARDQAYEQYMNLQRQPLPDMGPIARITSNYLSSSAKNPNAGFWNLAGALGAEPAQREQMQTANQQREVDAAKIGAQKADKDFTEADNRDKIMASLLKGTIAKPLSPEQMRPLYKEALARSTQLAKDQEFDSPDDRNAWILQTANTIMQDYIGKYGQGSGMPGVPGAAPQAEQAPQGVVQPKPLVQPAPTEPVPTKFVDKTEEARKKEFATESEKAATKYYNDNVKTAADVADSMLNNVATLRMIPRTQDQFAPYREKLGATFQALGLDNKLVKEAEGLQQVRPILTKIANDRLMLAKGVQTDKDAERAYNEFLKITDTQAAADFMYEWADEIARRAKFRNDVFIAGKDEQKSWQDLDNKYWSKTDYAQTAPVAFLNGKPWSYTKWRDAFIKANPDVINQPGSGKLIIETWNKLARGEK